MADNISKVEMSLVQTDIPLYSTKSSSMHLYFSFNNGVVGCYPVSIRGFTSRNLVMNITALGLRAENHPVITNKYFPFQSLGGINKKLLKQIYTLGYLQKQSLKKKLIKCHVTVKIINVTQTKLFHQVC